jgi:hypothetical protein
MQPHIPTAAKPRDTRESGIKFRTPVKDWPKRGDDKVHDYVLGVKHDALFDQVDISAGGYPYSFQKVVMPEHASYAENAGKHYQGGFPMVELTEKQAKKLRELVDAREKYIGPRPNPAYKHGESSREEEFLPAQTLIVGEWVILEKFADYDIVTEQKKAWEPAEPTEPEPRDEAEKIQKEIYDVQNPKKGRKK